MQVQQLLASGPSRNSQAVVAFQEILRLVRSVCLAADSRGPMQECFARLLQIACSESGLNRRMGWADFVTDCRALETSLGRLVADPEDDVATPWEAEVEALAQRVELKQGPKAALTTFFVCATRPFVVCVHMCYAARSSLLLPMLSLYAECATQAKALRGADGGNVPLMRGTM